MKIDLQRAIEVLTACGYECEDIEKPKDDAERYHWFCDYLIGTRTDLDDAFVAANSKAEIDLVIDSNMGEFNPLWEELKQELNLTDEDLDKDESKD